jgi:Right handed beta helix region
MADRTRWQIPVSTVPAIVFALLGCDGPNPAVAGSQVIAQMPVTAPTPTGTIYYVSPTGSDSAPGTSVAPWRTIQKAADTLRAGQTAIVAAGKYGERVSVSHSGTSAAPITLQAANRAYVQLPGFDLTGSHWVLSGFDITTRTNGSQGYGIHVSGSASYDTIQNNYIHELCHEGIFMESGVSQISVLNNRIWRAEMAGAQVDGTNDLIQGNEVWGTQQEPVRAGGIYSGCVTPDGADADGFRFFGQHNVFRSNYAHDIYTAPPTNPDPHTDCFQTWGSSAMKVDDIVIERNVCRWPVASDTVDASTAMIEGLDGPVGTVTFQNNQLSNMRQGINVGKNVGALKVYNNTWDHIVQQALLFNDNRSPADEVINNIFYDVGAGGDSYASVPSGNPTFKANDFYMPNGAPVGSYPSVEPFISVAPGFVNNGDSTAAGADLHLQPNSGLKGAGVPLPQVTDDFYGNARGTTVYSVGAAK